LYVFSDYITHGNTYAAELSRVLEIVRDRRETGNFDQDNSMNTLLLTQVGIILEWEKSLIAYEAEFNLHRKDIFQFNSRTENFEYEYDATDVDTWEYIFVEADGIGTASIFWCDWWLLDIECKFNVYFDSTSRCTFKDKTKPYASENGGKVKGFIWPGTPRTMNAAWAKIKHTSEFFTTEDPPRCWHWMEKDHCAAEYCTGGVDGMHVSNLPDEMKSRVHWEKCILGNPIEDAMKKSRFKTDEMLWKMQMLTFAMPYSAYPSKFQSEMQGHCVKADGTDQNANVETSTDTTINTKNKCLAWCENQIGLTGCEYIENQSNAGCYGHRAPVARGNGLANHFCWIRDCDAKVDKCLDRCASKYGGTYATNTNTYMCSKGCAGMIGGDNPRVGDKLLHCQRSYAECDSSCNGASGSVDHQNRCKYGCKFWNGNPLNNYNYPFSKEDEEDISDSQFLWYHDVVHEFACSMCKYYDPSRSSPNCQYCPAGQNGGYANEEIQVRQYDDADYMTNARDSIRRIFEDPCGELDSSITGSLGICQGDHNPNSGNVEHRPYEVELGAKLEKQSKDNSPTMEHKKDVVLKDVLLQPHSIRPQEAGDASNKVKDDENDEASDEASDVKDVDDAVASDLIEEDHHVLQSKVFIFGFLAFGSILFYSFYQGKNKDAAEIYILSEI